MQTNFALRLTINALLVLLGLKVWYFVHDHSHIRSLYLVSFVQDAMLLVVNYAICIGCTGRMPRLWQASRVVFLIVFLFVGMTSFFYTSYLPDLVSFPINVFGVERETAVFFLRYFLSVRLVLSLAGGLGILFLASWYFPKSVRSPRVLSFGGILLLVLFIASLFRGGISPIVYSLQEQIVLSAFGKNNVPRLATPVPDMSKSRQFQFLRRTFEEIPVVKSRYPRVVVLVMEGINYNQFVDESVANAKSFLSRHGEHLALYDRYHSTNLDSYTGLLVMLNSIFVPYQAYVREDKYSFLNGGNSLVRFFNANGYDTFFITSYGKYQDRFVPNRREWTQTKYLDGIEEQKRYACVTTNRIEYACEDLAILGDLVDLLKSHERAFVFQEMVYGHTSEWESKTGIGAIAYYDNYFNTLIEDLEKQNLLEGTLVVITSDHGKRDDAYDPENYHVPLMAFAVDLAPQRHPEFASHTDFKDILLTFAARHPASVLKRDAIFTVGNSGEFIYGMIGSDGKHVFINNRMGFAQGTLTEADVQRFHQQYQEYLDYFEYLRSRNGNQDR